jgi:acetyl-CoA carboxylase biotin carboxylase subunit
VVVANRGAVAARVLRALAEMGVRSVAIYSEADAGAPYLAMAGESYAIGMQMVFIRATGFCPRTRSLRSA